MEDRLRKRFKVSLYAIIVLLSLTVFANAWFFGPTGGEGFFTGGDKGGSSPSAGDVLLLETGDALLLETGDKLLLE